MIFAGNTIDMSSKIDGLAFVAGNMVTVSSSQDYLFVAGNSITLNGVSAKDVFVAGSNIVVKDSTIRDLYVAAQTVNIDSYIERNAYIGGDRVIINSTIDGNVKVAAENIKIGEEAVINGTLSYPEDANLEVAETATVVKTKSYASNSSIEINVTPMTMIASFITNFSGLLIVAFILLAIHKPLFKSLRKEKQEAGSVAKSMAIGFGVLVGLPIATILLLITVVGIPLSIIALVFYGVAIYLSSIPTAYYVANWIMKDKKANEYLLLGCALLALAILKVIPMIGGFVTFLSLILGLGLFTNFVIGEAQDKKEIKK